MGNLEAVKSVFNSWPEQLIEITSEEFLKLLPYVVAIEDRQPLNEKNHFAGNLKMFLFRDNTGIAVLSYGTKLTYHRFGCVHEWKYKDSHWPSVSFRTCTKCNITQEIDSGD